MSTDSASLYIVPTGPFKGVSALPGEISTRNDFDREYQSWDTHARTRHFLDVFPPTDGWSIDLVECDSGLQMADEHTRDFNQQPVYQPAWKFTAMLRDKDGRVVSTASVLQILNCPAAFETGQTRARGKLYNALGLPSSPGRDLDEPPLSRGRASQNTAVPKVGVDIVAVVDDKTLVTEPTTAAPEAAEATLDTSTTDPAPEPSTAAPDVADAAPTAPAGESLSGHDIDQEPSLPAVAVAPHPMPSTPAASGTSKADAKVSGDVPAGLLRQINQRALRAKVPVPAFSTVEQAQAFLATLVHPVKDDMLSSGANQ